MNFSCHALHQIAAASTMCLCSSPVVVEVSLYSDPVTVSEGSRVQICLSITALPREGMECYATVTLSITDGLASKTKLSIILISVGKFYQECS